MVYYWAKRLEEPMATLSRPDPLVRLPIRSTAAYVATVLLVTGAGSARASGYGLVTDDLYQQHCTEKTSCTPTAAAR